MAWLASVPPLVAVVAVGVGPVAWLAPVPPLVSH